MILWGLLLSSLVWTAMACVRTSNNPTTPGNANATPTPVATSPTTTPTAPTFTFIYNTYISGTCTGCHGSSGAQGSPMNASSKPAFYSTTVGVTAAFPTGCGGAGVLIVSANNATQSALYNRLAGGSCSPQMPQGGPFLTASQLADVAAWINAGALNN